MTLNDLKNFIEIESGRLEKCYGKCGDKEKLIFARMVKVTEEVGELCSEVLAKCDLQRPGKIKDHSHEKLSEELADVLITTLLLANSLDVDVENSLKKKIEKIEKRHLENI